MPKTHRPLTILLLVGLLFSFQNKYQKKAPSAEPPRVLDERLELTLFAEDPAIVTPIGIAVDSMNRVFVLESHTHLAPADYVGPKSDKIKIFIDEDGDGQPERMSVFAEGFREGLNLTFSPDGQLYVVTSRSVWVLYDRDGDGVSETRTKVLELVEPAKVYAHAALLGITFSPDGWMYVSRGNTGGAAWKMMGTDGSSLTGYGDGGSIVRARADGSQLEAVATGFWNPVNLKFNDTGHLLTVDNDPDSRGPNRLVDVIPGGDYGYQSLFGGSGINPYLAWNGELPGTLPYAVGLGEAPCDLLNASLAALPSDYQGQMLVSVWEESRIVRVSLKPRGASLTGSTEALVEGGPDFRPVSFATDRKGNIYFTDWVLRNYPNHGRGRIWKLSARSNVPTAQPRLAFAPPLPDAASAPLRTLYAENLTFGQLKNFLKSDDLYLRQAAVARLARSGEYQPDLVGATREADPNVRVGVLLALWRSGYQPSDTLMRQLLADADARVRQRTLTWIGEEGMVPLRPYLNTALVAGMPTLDLFETYLETIRLLQPAFVEAYRKRSEPYAKSIARTLPPQFIETFIQDDSHPAVLRALALKLLERPSEKARLLTALLRDKDPGLRLEAVRSLANVPAGPVAEQLWKVAASRDQPENIRAEALLALSRQPVDLSEKVVALLNESAHEVVLEAVRYLRPYVSVPKIRQALQVRYETLEGKKPVALKEQLDVALAAPATGVLVENRPASYGEWEKVLAQGGGAARGRRVFYSLQGVCSSCHAIEGRGGNLGPDLTNVGQSKSRNQLIRSILQPSAEISPEWQGWYVSMKNGDHYVGRQIDLGEKSLELYTQDRGFVTFQKKDVKDYGMSQTSLMPDGLEKQLTISDLRDLLAFLEAAK